MIPDIMEAVYAVTIAFFAVGLLRMGNPKTANSGILWAGIAMAFSIAITFLMPGLSNILLIIPAIMIGALVGWVAADKVAVVNMPQMVAIYNGMGAGAASSIAAIELLGPGGGLFEMSIAAAGAVIGNVSIAGSMIAFLKLQGWIRERPITFPAQQPLNAAILVISIVFVSLYLGNFSSSISVTDALALFFLFSLVYGVMMAIPIGGADMPVLISLFNAMTGLAVSLDGYLLSSFAMLVAGIFVGAAGIILTIAMARAMNRSIHAVLFGVFGKKLEEGRQVMGSIKITTAEDAAILIGYSKLVGIVPGFGMAAAQAQFRVRELADMLQSRGIKVIFGIHPVAGRMPGHMNVLLAEAGIKYEYLVDLEDANRLFPDVDVALVIGANDVVNPAARVPGSALYGMPILDVDRAKNVIVLKRGTGRGFAGIENDLFYSARTKMLYGDAQDTLSKLIQELKKI